MGAILVLAVDADVSARGKNFRITQIFDFEQVLARDLETGKTVRLPIAELRPPNARDITATSEVVQGRDLTGISDAAWAIARYRYSSILPLLALGTPTESVVRERASELSLHWTTLYRWMRRYRSGGVLDSLLPEKPGARKGQSRLPVENEEIIAACIESDYLTSQRLPVRTVVREVTKHCVRAGLRVPAESTIRRRIARIDEVAKVERRLGKNVAAQHYRPVPGSFPGADRPLSYIQIDHTPLNVILVDDLYRKPLPRCFLTVAIDVYSRMIAGFYIGLDSPTANSVGLCLAHAILPKDLWLSKLGIDGKWPVWGFMDAVHTDHGKDFRGTMLKEACENYGIGHDFRPVHTPHYGGHIERLIGTFSREIEELAGTTFASPQDRGEYKSDDRAALTIPEFEKWLATFITGVYHARPHRSLGKPPIQQYEEGIWGVPGQPGRGLPVRCANEVKLRLDFMPYLERTVQRTGILIDELHYYSDTLRPWIDSREPDNPARRRKFIVRRDPRDISVVYFYDPNASEYTRVPYRNTAHPAINLWELKEIRRRLKAEGRAKADERLIFQAYDRMRAIEDSARRTTKAVLRKQQRRRLQPEAQAGLLSTERPAVGSDRVSLAPGDEIEPFAGIEVGK